MSKHLSKTAFAYPVERICGKISRHSKVVHACTASGKQITYLQGERDLNAHPITDDEKSRMSLFKRRQAVVSLRVNHKAETYAADMAAYREQLNGESPVKGFRKWLWSVVKAEIAA